MDLSEATVIDTYSRRFASVEITQFGIECCSDYVFMNEENAELLARAMLKNITTPGVSNEQLLACMYILNDILQKSLPDHSVIHKEFTPVLEKAVITVAKSGDAGLIQEIQKIINLFENRCTFEKLFCERLRRQITLNRGGSMEAKEVENFLALVDDSIKLEQKFNEASSNNSQEVRNIQKERVNVYNKLSSFHSESSKKQMEQIRELESEIALISSVLKL